MGERLDRETSWAGLAGRCILRLRQVMDAKWSLYLLVAGWPDEADLKLLLEEEYQASGARLASICAAAGEVVNPYSGSRVALGRREVALLRQYLDEDSWQALVAVRGKLRARYGTAVAALVAGLA